MLAAAKVGIALLVLPLGDSITDGVPTEDGYRAFLTAELAQAGIELRYVGSRRSSAGAHEGWSGFTTEELLPKLRATLAGERPDVVLLHIGTNDLGLGIPITRAVENVRKMLVLIHERSRPGKPTQVFLARIIGRNLFGSEPDRELETYNDRLEELAAVQRKAGQPVTIVDMQAALTPSRDLADALHPNVGGYRKMAAAWAAALRAKFAKPTSSP